MTHPDRGHNFRLKDVASDVVYPTASLGQSKPRADWMDLCTWPCRCLTETLSQKSWLGASTEGWAGRSQFAIFLALGLF